MSNFGYRGVVQIGDDNPNGFVQGQLGERFENFALGDVYENIDGNWQWKIVDHVYIGNSSAQLRKPKIYFETVTTDSSGNFTVTFPSGYFTNTPTITVTPNKPAANATQVANAALTSKSSTGASGKVTTGTILSILGATIVGAGAGVSVDIIALGS